MVYFMVLVALFIGSPTVAEAYTIFSKGEFPMASHYFHPQLDKSDPDIFIVTAPEGGYLKAVMYRYDKEDDTYLKSAGPYYLPNPQKRDFSGMPVRYVRGEGCFLFSDGTRLYPELPSDTHKTGSSAKWYELRWRRVYKNYYLMTLFRGEGEALREELVTTKDGTDLTPILGESSKEKGLKGYSAVFSTEDPYIRKLEKENGEKRYTLIPLTVVEEKYLPSNFPKGLVRWIP